MNFDVRPEWHLLKDKPSVFHMNTCASNRNNTGAIYVRAEAGEQKHVLGAQVTEKLAELESFYQTDFK